MSNVIVPIVAVAAGAALGIAAALTVPSMNSGDSSGSVTYTGDLFPDLIGEYELQGTTLLRDNEPFATVINMYDDGGLYDSNVYMNGRFVGKLRGNEWSDD